MNARVDGHDQQVLRAEPDIDVGRALKTAQKKTREAKQNHRHRNLSKYEEVTQVQTAAWTDKSVFSFECTGKHRMRGCPCWSHAQQQAAEVRSE